MSCMIIISRAPTSLCSARAHPRMSALDTAFKRHSRAQVTSVSDAARSNPSSFVKLTPPQSTHSKEGVVRRSRVLNAQRTPSWVQSSGQALVPVELDLPKDAPSQESVPVTLPQQAGTALLPRSQWVDYVKLGTLVQGGRELLVCSSRIGRGLFMLKGIGREVDGHKEKAAMLRHRHIALTSFFIATETTFYVAFQYIRYTLEELLHIHVAMDEEHIRAISLPVFQALKYLNNKNLLHGNVSVQTIRVCGRSGNVVLGDCDSCEEATKPTSTDLEGLGIVMLNCMEASLTDLTATRVRECRASNKVFGLNDPEKWSEHKQLVDFIDDIFSAQRRPTAKFVKPEHEYVAHGSWDPEVLTSLVELASLECFTLWHAI